MSGKGFAVGLLIRPDRGIAMRVVRVRGIKGLKADVAAGIP